MTILNKKNEFAINPCPTYHQHVGGISTGWGGNSDDDYMKQPTKQQCLYTLIDLVKYPVITEKTYISSVRNGQYTFDIDKRLTKTQIKKLFSSLFKVSVVAVNTHMLPRKKIRVGMAQGFRPTFKRVIITLKKGDSINYNLTNMDFNNNN